MCLPTLSIPRAEHVRIFIDCKTQNILGPLFFFYALTAHFHDVVKSFAVAGQIYDRHPASGIPTPRNIPGIRSGNRPTSFPGKTTPLRPFRRRLIQWKSIFQSRSYLNGTRDSGERPCELFWSMRRTSFRYGSHVKCRENNARFYCRLS